MSASPEFFKPACAKMLVFGDGYDDDCRTPTGNRISYLGEATTCPPAPRKKPPPPPPCRKRLLFQGAQLQAAGDQPPAAESSFAVVVPIISLRLDELERLFRPHPSPATTTTAVGTTTTAADNRRRRSSTCSSVFANKRLNCLP